MNQNLLHPFNFLPTLSWRKEFLGKNFLEIVQIDPYQCYSVPNCLVRIKYQIRLQNAIPIVNWAFCWLQFSDYKEGLTIMKYGVIERRREHENMRGKEINSFSLKHPYTLFFCSLGPGQKYTYLQEQKPSLGFYQAVVFCLLDVDEAPLGSKRESSASSPFKMIFSLSKWLTT